VHSNLSPYPIMNKSMIDPTTGQEVPGSGQTTESFEEVMKERDELQKFFNGATPLLEKLNASPDLVQAILADKVNDEFAKAALAGTLSTKDAEIATAAAVAVEKQIGTKAFNAADPDELSRLMEEKVSALESKLAEKDDQRQFESYTNQFISETSDFTKYSQAIADWLDDHDVTDIRVAYYAVKGELSEKQAKEAADAEASNIAKDFMITQGGGGIHSNATINSQPLIDSLVANRSNPNRF